MGKIAILLGLCAVGAIVWGASSSRHRSPTGADEDVSAARSVEGPSSGSTTGAGPGASAAKIEAVSRETVIEPAGQRVQEEGARGAALEGSRRQAWGSAYAAMERLGLDVESLPRPRDLTSDQWGALERAYREYGVPYDRACRERMRWMAELAPKLRDKRPELYVRVVGDQSEFGQLHASDADYAYFCHIDGDPYMFRLSPTQHPTVDKYREIERGLQLDLATAAIAAIR